MHFSLYVKEVAVSQDLHSLGALYSSTIHILASCHCKVMQCTITRLVPIMLLKLPISYALEQCSRIMLKLCSICKPVFSTNSKFAICYLTKS